MHDDVGCPVLRQAKEDAGKPTSVVENHNVVLEVERLTLMPGTKRDVALREFGPWAADVSGRRTRVRNARTRCDFAAPADAARDELIRRSSAH